MISVWLLECVFSSSKEKEKIGVFFGDTLQTVTKCRPEGKHEREIQKAKYMCFHWTASY